VNEEEEEEKFSVLVFFCEYVCTLFSSFIDIVVCYVLLYTSRLSPSVIIISLFTFRLQSFAFGFDQAQDSPELSSL